jgi:uncharacterized protein
MAITSPGQFVWHEHLTKDPKAAIAFYTEVVGWKTEPFGESGDYTIWLSAQGPLGGVTQLPEQAVKMGAPPHWMGSVQVSDVDSTAALVRKLGGKVYKEPFDIPTVGRQAVIADPQGATLSIFTPSRPMAGREASKEGEFCWNELLTSDSTAAFDFYSKVFGWKITKEFEMGPKGVYRFFASGDKDVGGLMTIPADMPMPPSWVYYIETSDIDAAIGRATKRAAKVMNGPQEVPGGGKLAQLADPQGAFFALYQSPRA